VHSRELALQIAHVARALAAALPGRADERVCCLTNGAPYTPQRAQLRGGAVRLVVATPSRLLYHVGEDNVSLHGLRVLAADEADALLCQRGGPLAGEARQVPARQGGRAHPAHTRAVHTRAVHTRAVHTRAVHTRAVHAPCDTPRGQVPRGAMPTRDGRCSRRRGGRRGARRGGCRPS